jgi:hypothetical protein
MPFATQQQLEDVATQVNKAFKSLEVQLESLENRLKELEKPKTVRSTAKAKGGNSNDS